MINLVTNDIKLEIVKKRKQQTMQNLNEENVGKDNISKRDSWPTSKIEFGVYVRK